MTGRIVIAVCVAILAYAVYSWYFTSFSAGNEGFDINSQSYESAQVRQAPAPPMLMARTQSPSGPGAPNQQPANEAPTVVMPPETPMDPQDKQYESAEIPERLRHPERSFSPGLVNEDTAQSVASGIASHAQKETASANLSFGPEHVQNGGQFLEGGVMANDLTLETGYSEL